MISDRIFFAYREHDMVTMMVYRTLDGDLVSRVVPDLSLAEACIRYGVPARFDPRLKFSGRWLHRKSRGAYTDCAKRVTSEAAPEGGKDVLYRCLSQGIFFLRPEAEFMDGRFTLIGAAA